MNATLLGALCALSVSVASADTSGLEGPNFHARPATIQTAVFLGIQHGFRFATEPGTREELKATATRSS